jgi:SAM-dependent methyltransferase
MQHLIDKGVLPQNIAGIDVSSQMLLKAKERTIGVELVVGTADSLPIDDAQFDLVIANTMLHHLGNEQLERALENVYRILKPNGTFFIIDTDPDHTEEGRDERNDNKWSMVATPWGGEVPFFQRSARYLFNLLDLHGFDMKRGWLLQVDTKGEESDPVNFEKYSSRPSRMAARFVKVDERVKEMRQGEMLGLTDENLD